MIQNLLVCLSIVLVISCKPSANKEETSKTVNSQHIASLPNEVDETSALVFHEGFLYTLNDSGGDPIIYQIDTANFKVTKKNHILEVPNIDWEALIMNKTHVFIGDFGNNYGTRNDLCIYFFDKTELNNTHANPRKISFTYANWEAPAKNLHGTQFDSEAMLAFDDTLWVFTKCWNDNNTTIYKLPIEEGNHNLHPWKTLTVDGLVTDACFGIQEGEIWLTGYKNYVSLLWKLNFNDSLQSVEIKNRWVINTPDSIQNEGICFVGNELWFSSESSKTVPAAVYKVVFPANQ
jgi:hypothetical protein